jgi:hypothetical protein
MQNGACSLLLAAPVTPQLQQRKRKDDSKKHSFNRHLWCGAVPPLWNPRLAPLPRPAIAPRRSRGHGEISRVAAFPLMLKKKSPSSQSQHAWCQLARFSPLGLALASAMESELRHPGLSKASFRLHGLCAFFALGSLVWG